MLTLALVFQIAATSADDALSQIHNYVRISDGLATSGQMTYEQIEDIAAAGFEVVINLAPAREERNGREGFLVAERGVTYVNIPVDWQRPTLRDLDMFFAVMDANRDRKVFVHCFANMRASAFTYLYRTLVLKEGDAEALPAMKAIWDPASQEQWQEFIEAARARAAGSEP
jgi:uncharacterized protein (TIGR01244 family)